MRSTRLVPEAANIRRRRGRCRGLGGAVPRIGVAIGNRSGAKRMVSVDPFTELTRAAQIVNNREIRKFDSKKKSHDRSVAL